VFPGGEKHLSSSGSAGSWWKNGGIRGSLSEEGLSAGGSCLSYLSSTTAPSDLRKLLVSVTSSSSISPSSRLAAAEPVSLERSTLV
jgi:hypothetical protein